jgi:hypothetical protein
MRWAPGVQITLQDKNRGHLIHHLTPTPAAHIRLNQHPFSRRGGKALIPRDDVDPQGFTQGAGELQYTWGCSTEAAIHMAG